MQFCEVCRRPRNAVVVTDGIHKPCMQRMEGGSVRYHHDFYGCDTGCCGHRMILTDAKGNEVWSEFEFTHNKDALDASARELSLRYNITLLNSEYIDD